MMPARQTLPIPALHTPRPRLAADTSDPFPGAPADPPPDIGPEELRETHVLVVEDDPGIATLVSRIAGSAGCRVTCVTSVEAFRRELATSRPSLVLLDLRLAGGDGVDVFAHLSATNPSVPVIVFTGYGERALYASEQLAESLGLTVAGLFTKPLDVGRFRETLSWWADGRAAPGRVGSPTRARALKHAILRDEIVPYYQPQIELASGPRGGRSPPRADRSGERAATQPDQATRSKPRYPALAMSAIFSA